jgi:ribonuclease E
MELSRQRLRPSLSEGSHVTCPRCNGTGHIRDTESSGLQVLRIIQEEAMKENSAAIHVQAPVDVAAFMLNEKRGEILKIETRHRVNVILIPNKHLETPHYKLERLKHDDPRLEDMQASYSLAEQAETDIGYNKREKDDAKPRQEAMVKSITPDQPAPVVDRSVPVAPLVADVATEGFLSKLFGLFRKKPAVAVVPAITAKPAQRERGERAGRNPRGRGRNGRGGRDKTEEKAVAPAVEAREPKETTQRQPKPQREPREPREVREPREPREPREAREGTDPRRERAARGQREERKEQAEQAEDKLIIVPAIAEATAEGTEDELLRNPSEDAAVEGDEQPRRRRRRGGRNRNRRDRDPSETASSENAGADDDITVHAEAAHEEMTSPAPAFVPVAELTEASSHADKIVTSQAHSALGHVPAPVYAEPVQASPEPVLATPVVVAPVAAAPVIAEPAVATPVVTATAAEATVVVAEVPVAEPVLAAPAPQAQAAVAAPEPAPAPTPVATPAATPVRHAAPPAANLDEVLKAAGLMMAVTNPDKLRAVQAAAMLEMPAAAPVGRERKPVVIPEEQPLVQIETQR